MKNKNEIRKKILNIRNNLNNEYIKEKNNIIIPNLINFIKKNSFKNILIYMDMKNEVKASHLPDYFSNENINFYIPKIFKDKSMKINNFNKNKLILHKFGYYESSSENYINEEIIDLIIIPGIVFDKNKNRIGFGGGYYDRFLFHLKNLHKKNNSIMPIIIAPCYDFQLLENIPSETHDIKVNYIITEKNIF